LKTKNGFFQKKFEVKLTSTGIVLGWVTLQEEIEGGMIYNLPTAEQKGQWVFHGVLTK